MGIATDSRKRLWVTGGSIAGLTLGFALGAWSHSSSDSWLSGFAAAVEPIGTLWGNALRMIVMPLIIAQLLHCIVVSRETASVGRITGLSFGVFTAILVVGAAITVLAIPPLVSQMQFSPGALAALREAVFDGPRPEAVPPATFSAWLSGLIPINVLRAATQDNLVGVLIFTFAFGFAVAGLPAERRQTFTELSRVAAEALMTIVGWIMWAMPIAVFALAMSTASRGGFGTLSVIVAFVVLVCTVLLAWTLLFYPVAALLGRVSIARFARAMLPVQLVAIGTRSSIASLPSLVDNAQNKLGLRQDVSSIVMALAVTTFKASYPLSAPVQFIFVAHVYGVPLSLAQIAGFSAGILVLSYASVGIPGGGAFMRAAPFYVAAGVPIEGYLLTEAVEAIPDVFKTLVNVTGDMTAAAIVNRVVSGREGQAVVEAEGQRAVAQL